MHLIGFFPRLSSITDVVFSGPLNSTKETTTTGEYVINWTPTSENFGQHFPICFAAEGQYGYDCTDYFNQNVPYEMKLINLLNILGLGTISLRWGVLLSWWRLKVFRSFSKILLDIWFDVLILCVSLKQKDVYTSNFLQLFFFCLRSKSKRNLL